MKLPVPERMYVAVGKCYVGMVVRMDSEFRRREGGRVLVRDEKYSEKFLPMAMAMDNGE